MGILLDQTARPMAARNDTKEEIETCEASTGRMIENSRDEEVCRAWDVLADEDHTYHMSEEEYFYYKNNW